MLAVTKTAIGRTHLVTVRWTADADPDWFHVLTATGRGWRMSDTSAGTRGSSGFVEGTAATAIGEDLDENGVQLRGDVRQATVVFTRSAWHESFGPAKVWVVAQTDEQVAGLDRAQ